MIGLLVALWMGFPPLDTFPAATFKERWPAPWEELQRRPSRFQDNSPLRRYAMETGREPLCPECH
jgi:hypothetical protein